MSDYNNNQPPSGERPRSPGPDSHISQSNSPRQTPPDQTAWQGQPSDPWRTPPEPRAPYVPDRPPVNGGANDWVYEHPQAPRGGDTSVMSVKDWLKCYLLMLIPFAGFILPFVWAFGGGNLNRRNMFRAMLILWAIGLGIYTVLFLLIFAAVMSVPYFAE
ncbi:MAG: hypothetical protein LBB94_02750 [Clostridiales bacterium]|nr:hypothetical protein [Clostridiales bacterium]